MLVEFVLSAGQPSLRALPRQCQRATVLPATCGQRGHRLCGPRQQDSSLLPSVRRDGRTSTPSLTLAAALSSHACCGPANAQAALLMARELLRYRPADDLCEDSLDRIAELVSAAGEAPASSR